MPRNFLAKILSISLSEGPIAALVLSVMVVSLDFMERIRQSIPEGLANMPTGVELAAVLARIDPSRLGGADCVEVMRARHRQASHEQARLMAAMVEVALCGIGPDDELPRMECPDEFSADEIRGALAWTRRAADNHLSLAWDLIHRLPQVFAALDAGDVDVPKTKVFSEWTSGLTEAQAHQICDRLLPEASRLTTGLLIERIKKMAIAIDPDWARRRYEEAVRDRKVVGYRNEDGSANLSGYNLPADRAAAACAHIDALAKKIKHAGDYRPIDHIRADLYVAMLDGSYTGWTERDIITHMLTVADTDLADNSHADAHDSVRPFRRSNGQSRDRRNVPHSAAGQSSRDGKPGGAEQVDGDAAGEGRGDEAGSGVRPMSGEKIIERPSEPRLPVPPARRAGVEVRAEITMLLGLNAHPAEIAGWGFIHAEAARGLVFAQTAAEWRYAIADENGHLLYEGITRRRPDGYPPRAKSPTSGGIVELHIKLSDLRRLALRPGRLCGWAAVIADLARQADQHQRDARQLEDDARGGRRPSAPLRRRTQIRDRTCGYPGCRTPAHATDGDHTRDWARGGSTVEDNIASLCRHDHRLKHQGGWTLTQPEPGIFAWTSRLGVHYHVRPPLIIEPVPEPIPRDRVSPRWPLGGDDDTPIWWERAGSPPAPERPPRPPPEDPPF
jgi:hypothetical protein